MDVARFIGFHTKTHLEGENYHANKLLFKNVVCIAVIVTLSMRTENEVEGSSLDYLDSVRWQHLLALTIDGVDIERVNQFTILDFTLMSHLNWSKHTDNIANRCSRTIGLITKLEHIIQTKINIALYNMILPQTNYYLLS